VLSKVLFLRIRATSALGKGKLKGTRKGERLEEHANHYSIWFWGRGMLAYPSHPYRCILFFTFFRNMEI